jgi:hypothetical protein
MISAHCGAASNRGLRRLRYHVFDGARRAAQTHLPARRVIFMK